jgi:hypothetical protein
MPIFPTVIASILYIGRPVVGNAAYLSPSIAFLPSVLGNSQVIFHCPPWAVFLVPGMSSQFKLLYILPAEPFLLPLHVGGGGLHYYYTCPDFIPFPCINHLSISTSIPEPVHSPQSPSYRSILILFTKLFSLFLVCISDFFIGTTVAVLWLFLCGFPPVFGSHVLFSSDGHIYRLLCPTPHSISKRTPYSPPLFLSVFSHRSPVCESQSCCAYPWFLSSRVRSNQCFPTLSQPLFFGSTRGLSVIHRHSFTPFSPLLDLGRVHRNPFKAPLHSSHLLARHGYCVHFQCVLLRCSALEEGE